MKIGFYVPAWEHLGVEILSAALKEAGHTTEVFFDPRLWTDGPLANGLLGRCLDVEDMVVEDILGAGLDILCFSVVTDTFSIARRVSAKVKQHRDIPTIFGGIHCTCVPERVVSKPEVDYVVVGEGEHALVELCEALAKGQFEPDLPNVWYRKRNSALVAAPPRPVVADLDTLPFVDKDVFYEKVPGYFKKRYTAVASRGCMNSCTFCNNSVYKRMYDQAGLGPWKRQRSVDNVIEELVCAKERYDFDYVYFFDEIFLDDGEWIEDFCRKYGKAVGMPFWCYGHAQFITEDMVGMLDEAGCREINIGVQTFREATRRDYLRRGGSNETIVRAIDIISDSGISLSTGNMMELPGQPIEEALELAAFHNDHRVDLPIVSFLRYYPRTEIVDIAIQEGILTENDVEGIEEAEQGGSMYYVGPRTEWSRDYQKTRLLILMTTWVPRKVVQWLLDSGRWRWLPASGLLNLMLGSLGSLRFFATGKRPLPDDNYTAWRYAGRTVRYGSAKLRWKRRKLLGWDSGKDLLPGTDANAGRKSPLRFLWILGLALYLVAIWLIGWRKLGTTLSATDVRFLGAVMAVEFGAQWFRALKWRFMLGPGSNAFGLFFLSRCAGYWMPMRMGELSPLLIKKHRTPKMGAWIVVDRVLEISSTLTLGVIGLIALQIPMGKFMAVFVAAACAFVFAPTALLTQRRLFLWIADRAREGSILHRASMFLAAIRDEVIAMKRRIAVAAVMTVVAGCMDVAAGMLLYGAFGEVLPFAAGAASKTVHVLTSAIPITPNATGVPFATAGVFVNQVVGIPPHVIATAIPVGVVLINIVFWTSVGLASTDLRRRLPQDKD